MLFKLLDNVLDLKAKSKFSKLLDEVEYDLKNYHADRGGCRLEAEADNSLSLVDPDILSLYGTVCYRYQLPK